MTTCGNNKWNQERQARPGIHSLIATRKGSIMFRKIVLIAMPTMALLVVLGIDNSVSHARVTIKNSGNGIRSARTASPRLRPPRSSGRLTQVHSAQRLANPKFIGR
jgi:uncharacterized membrane protein YvbJ